MIAPSLISILLTIMGAIAGNAVVLAVLGYLGRTLLQSSLSKDLERYKSELKSDADDELERVRNTLTRDVESYKVKLKKSEFLFEREFLAASGFMKLYGDFAPQKSHPDMDWDDAMDMIANNAHFTEQKLDAFMREHGAALNKDDREKLSSAVNMANDLALEMGGCPPAQVNEEASKLYHALEDLRDSLIARVRDQSSL
ncbi:MAG: hypothetical protein JWP35_1420 [Caulobacter sp.]|nr:hypothetical protein [Caulobacter sp.]